MRKVTALLASGLALAVARDTCALPAQPSGVAPPGSMATEAGDAEADARFLSRLVESTKNASNYLAGLGDPIFSAEGGIAIQMQPEKPVSVAVLFAEYGIRDGRRVALEGLCRTFGISEKSTYPARHVINCNPRELKKLESLLRAVHSPSFTAVVANDWGFMQLVKGLGRDPNRLPAGFRSDVSDDHMVEHLSFLLAFLLAHEAWHLAHATDSGFVAPSDGAPLVGVDQRTLVCRNFREFARQGMQFEMKLSLEPLDEEEPAADPAARSELARSRALWREELEADRYAGGLLARLILKGREAGVPESALEHLFSELMQHFGVLALAGWHERLLPFAETRCQPHAGRDFFLTRCMCETRERYVEVVDLFSPTHAPILLRMYTAAWAFARGLGIEKDVNVVFPGSSRDLQLAVLWHRLVGAMSDVPLKLSMTGCVVPQRAVAPQGRIVQVFPDLAGFFGPNRSAVYPGYPKDEAALMRECASASTQNGSAAPATPAAATATPQPTAEPETSSRDRKPLGDFRVSIMSGERCIIQWSPAEPVMTEQTLRTNGVDVEAVLEALRRTVAAVFGRSAVDVQFLPGEPSDVMPGPAYRISSLGSRSKAYDSFHLYVTGTEIQLMLWDARGSHARKAPLRELGIDWRAVREGIGQALRSLYRNAYDVRIGDPEVVTYKGEDWHYRARDMLVPRRG